MTNNSEEGVSQSETPLPFTMRTEVTVSQAERISRIHFLLQLNGQVTVAELKSEFEVSRSTVMRDIEFMRDRLFAPIEYDAGSNAYVYSDGAGATRLHQKTPFRIPGMWIDAHEAYAMLTLINVLGKVDPGVLMPFVSPLKAVLKKILCERRFPMRGFHKKVVVNFPNLGRGDKAVARNICTALVDELQTTLDWQGPGNEVRRETISIQRFVLGVKGWEVEVLVEKGPERLSIPFSRISKCELTSHRATILPEFKSDPEADWIALKDIYMGERSMSRGSSARLPNPDQ